MCSACCHKLLHLHVPTLCIRGGVEGTRLEAKDTKKIQGQGQLFRGQTLSRPRTGVLEAKAKDQGHKRKYSPKKKIFKKNFKAISKKKKKKGLPQKFFKRFPQKNVFQKIFKALHKILTIQKILLSSSRGQANFRGLEASRPRPRTWPSRPRPRTSKSVLEDQWRIQKILVGGDFKHKTSKIRMSSPKLRVIFRPDSLRLGWWGRCIPKWSRIIRNRGWFFGQNRYF